MNDHRTLSPISEHPIPISSPAAPVELDAHCRGYAAAVQAARFGLPSGVVEAVGRDGLRRVDPAFVDEASMECATTDQIDSF
jgi:hypothetical protein